MVVVPRAAALAARLKTLGVESVMAERNSQVGDNWARRYDCMRFHIPTSFCDFPFMRKSFLFPSRYKPCLSDKVTWHHGVITTI